MSENKLNHNFDISLELDPLHAKIDPFAIDLVRDIWADKYRYKNEPVFAATADRVAFGVLAPRADASDDEISLAGECSLMMQQGLLMPGGRIIAGAGTEKRVTLMNCYVGPKIQDSMDTEPSEPGAGIMDALKVSAITQQQSGGIGNNFSTVRPRGARVNRTNSVSSGVLPFMDMWHGMCSTIRSAGSRRGAMMGTLADWHPDLPEFITAKHEPGRLTNFNVSVLVSDAFMRAVQEDDDWFLYFNVPPAEERMQALVDEDFEDADGQQYVYSKWRARELWDMITKNTYEYSEPGIIFIDRINDLNNLQYCEEIFCTNPCGEQPLPHDGTCNLGAVNLARMVRDPFTPKAKFDFTLLSAVTTTLTRFLDGVIDVTLYPTKAQEKEEFSKRRLGIGVSGLADAFIQLGLVYGSPASVRMAEDIMRTIAVTAYTTSAVMAGEKGVFPLYSPEILERPFIKKLPETVQSMIKLYGLRNGVLLTIAPTGTTSILYGNISSGIEPIFDMKVDRKVRQPDGNTYKTYYDVPDYAVRLWEAYTHQGNELPPVFVAHDSITLNDHLNIQAACQRWVDASVSKTINLPKDISYEDFKHVYSLAYELGCKGCTTYRPSDVRGSILSSAKDRGSESAAQTIRPRPETLQGYTYKVKWPQMNAAIYVTINQDEKGKPFEIFITSKDARNQEWITGLTLMISAIMRRGDDISFIPQELKQIHSVHDSAFVEGKFYGSLVSRIADVIEEHFVRVGVLGSGDPDSTGPEVVAVPSVPQVSTQFTGEPCPVCSAPTLRKKEGCSSCSTCGYSSC